MSPVADRAIEGATQPAPYGLPRDLYEAFSGVAVAVSTGRNLRVLVSLIGSNSTVDQQAAAYIANQATLLGQQHKRATAAFKAVEGELCAACPTGSGAHSLAWHRTFEMTGPFLGMTGPGGHISPSAIRDNWSLISSALSRVEDVPLFEITERMKVEACRAADRRRELARALRIAPDWQEQQTEPDTVALPTAMGQSASEPDGRWQFDDQSGGVVFRRTVFSLGETELMILQKLARSSAPVAAVLLASGRGGSRRAQSTVRAHISNLRKVLNRHFDTAGSNPILRDGRGRELAYRLDQSVLSPRQAR